MTTLFPGDFDSLTNPLPTDQENVVSHASQHQNSNDSIEALEVKVGKNSDTNTASHDYKLSSVTGSDKAVGRTATQTLTGKTIDGDDNTIQDLALTTLKTILADASKFLVRDSSGVVVSNTKSVPNGDVVGTSDTQTLSSKSLVQPYIGNFQSAQHNHSSESQGGLLPAGSLGVGSVQPNNLQNGTGTSWAWQSWIPTWTATTTNPGIGNGTLQGYYTQIGKTILFRINLIFGSTSSVGSGTYFLSLPVTANSNLATGTPIGDIYIEDTGTIGHNGVLRLSDKTKFLMNFQNADQVKAYTQDLTHAAPVAWGDGDFIRMSGFYEVAETSQEYIGWILPQPSLIAFKKPNNYIYPSLFMTLGAV